MEEIELCSGKPNFCIACGNKFQIDEKFCIKCGKEGSQGVRENETKVDTQNKFYRNNPTTTNKAIQEIYEQQLSPLQASIVDCWHAMTQLHGSVYTYPNIPEGIFDNIEADIEPFDVNEPIVGVQNNTLLSSTLDGAVFTTTGVYWKNRDGHKGRIRYTDILSDDVNFELSTLGTTKFFVTRKQHIELELLDDTDSLKKLVSFVRGAASLSRQAKFHRDDPTTINIAPHELYENKLSSLQANIVDCWHAMTQLHGSVYTYPNIPEGIFDNIEADIEPFDENEPIVGVQNNTLLSSTLDGAVFTTTGVYWKNRDGNKGRIRYTDILADDVNFELSTFGATKFFVTGTQYIELELLDDTDSLKKLVSFVRNAASLSHQALPSECEKFALASSAKVRNSEPKIEAQNSESHSKPPDAQVEENGDQGFEDEIQTRPFDWNDFIQAGLQGAMETFTKGVKIWWIVIILLVILKGVGGGIYFLALFGISSALGAVSLIGIPTALGEYSRTATPKFLTAEFGWCVVGTGIMCWIFGLPMLFIPSLFNYIGEGSSGLSELIYGLFGIGTPMIGLMAFFVGRYLE